MDVSIVIVSWNTYEITRECLQSVYAGLDGVTAEVILVDNASDDGSADMVSAEFPETVLIRNTKNLGFAAANNQAFEIANGRQILLLNSDTLVRGNVLIRSVAYLDEYPKVGAMGCRVLNTDGSVQLTCARYPTLFNQLLLTSGLWKLKWPRFLGRQLMTDWHRDSERAVDTISGCYLLVRKEILEDVGPLDDAFFFFGEETDWCRRMRDAGWRLMFAPVGEITHHGSVSARKLNHKRDVMLSQAIVRLHRKHGGLLAGTATYALIIAFNASRAVFWSLAALGASPRAIERAAHFWRVTAAFPAAWPRPRAEGVSNAQG